MPSKSTRKGNNFVSSAAFRAALTAAATRPGDTEARGLIAKTGALFAGLASATEDEAVRARWRSEGEQLAAAITKAPSEASRLAAADVLADTYAALFRGTSGGTVAYVPHPRASSLTVARKGAVNPGLAGLLELWDEGGHIRPPVIDTRGPGAAILPCVPGLLRAAVRKPGMLEGIQDAGLDADFLDFLREKGLISLRSYSVWRAAQGPGDPTSEDDYQVALAAGFRLYEEARFADRYCRPGDIPAPGEQHGHRLLRLPLRLAQADFRDAGCGPQIYEGELGMPEAPELDYAELVRRYVDLLRPSSRWRVDVNAVSRSDIVTSHLRHLINADNPNLLQLLVVATQIALQLRTVATLLNLDDDLARQGHRLDSWLVGPGGADIKAAVMDAWNRLVNPQAIAPLPAAVLPVGALTVHGFANALIALCVLPVPEPPAGTPEPPFEEPLIVGPKPRQVPGSFFTLPNPARSAADVQAEMQRLIQQYDAVWSAASQALGPDGLRNARNDIRLSGLEARAHIGWLTVAALVSNPRWSQQFDVSVTVAAVEAIEAWLALTPVSIDYEDVVGRLPDNQPNTAPIKGHPSKQYWDVTPPPTPGKDTLHDEARAALALVIDSYAEAMDAVVSLSGAQGAAPASSAAAPAATISPGDLPALFQSWSTLFVAFLDEQRAKRLVVNEPLLVLRLAPRRGRYGETPQRTADEELTREVKAAAWPGHPTRATEAYVLEPLPLSYFMRHSPQLYLREDYHLRLMPRGYGIGANLYSMSLLPQEEQTVVVKSFKDTRSKVSESTAETIFEEAGSETSNDFANELASENQQETSNQSDFNIAAKASASVLFASAELSSGYSNKDSSRDFAKNVSNLTSKLAQKLSSKRTVSVETKREGETEEGTRNEVSTERTFKNPNMGHAVTFHWFQMTRKFLHELWLEDAKLVYTSGKHNVLRILTNSELPQEIRNLAPSRVGMLNNIFLPLEEDVARRMPLGAAVVIVSEPYTEVVSMSAANGFLARAFTTPRAVEINSALWRCLGYFDPAPDGLGVLAFTGNRPAEAGVGEFVRLDNPNPRQPGDSANSEHVAADIVRVILNGVDVEESFYLPNLDLRYRAADGVPPARYTAPRYYSYALPRLLRSDERVVDTNGIFCEAMVGRCTALEDYLQRHRELDLLEKKISVGRQEIEFHWSLAKDNLVMIQEDADRAITAVVRPVDGTEPFAERIALERARLAEQRVMAEADLERKKVELELAFRQEQINELQQRIALMPTPPPVVIDAPDGANVAVRANIDIGARGPDPNLPGGAVTVE